MASVKQRGNSYEVRWRAGRQGETQTCTFHDEKLAETARDLAKARDHKISDTEVYAALLGFLTQPAVPETAGSPYIKELIEEFLEQKVDVKESTKKEYARLLHGTWVTQNVGDVPALAGLRVTELDRDKHVNPWKAEVSKALAPALSTQALGRAGHGIAHRGPAALPIRQPLRSSVRAAQQRATDH